MPENVKINYVQYGKGSKKNKGKSRPSGSSGGSVSSANARECGGSNVNAGEYPKHVRKGKKTHYIWTSVGGVENLDIRKVNHVKLQRQSAEAVEQRGIMRKCV